MEIKRLDHLGITGVIRNLKLIEAINERLQKDTQKQEKITPREALSVMIMNGLGFSDKLSRPNSLVIRARVSHNKQFIRNPYNNLAVKVKT